MEATGAPKNELGVLREAKLPEGVNALELGTRTSAHAEDDEAELEITGPSAGHPAAALNAGGRACCANNGWDSTVSLAAFAASDFEKLNIIGLCSSGMHGPPRLPLLGVNEKRLLTELGAFGTHKVSHVSAGTQGLEPVKWHGFETPESRMRGAADSMALDEATGGSFSEEGTHSAASPAADSACLR